MKRFFVCTAILLLAIQQNIIAQDTVPLLHGAHHTGNRNDADMNRWRGYGLGQFIHFGLYSILGGQWNGENYNGAAEWIRSWSKLPNADYDSLYKKFNPTEFDAEKWAAMAKEMGVKYVTITTKHHDGFCIWPSKFTHFTVANSPYKKDLIAPLVKAYNKAGIDVYLYFSIMDWSNPDWRYDLKNASDSIAFNRFKIFTKNQLTELLTNYPTAKGLWFDGTWDKSWQKSGAFTDTLEQYLKQLHPGLIIGSRLRADDNGKRHFDSNGKLMGDYEQGWERKMPANYADTKGYDWDCVMTIPENGWGYQKQWLGHVKTTGELIEDLANCVSLNGNFVLNFGPMPNGTFRNEEVLIAKKIGNWMTENHDAIYNARYTGWDKQDWGYTSKSEDGKKVYLMVFNVPTSAILKVKPAKNQLIEKAYFMDQPNKLLSVQKSDYGVSLINIPSTVYGQPFVIVLEMGAGKENIIETQKAKT